HQSGCAGEWTADQHCFCARLGSRRLLLVLELEPECLQLGFQFPNGQMQIVVVPNTNYVGPVTFSAVVSSSSIWSYFPTLFPYDLQEYTFAFGDTPIVAQATNFTAITLTSFTNQ